MSLHALIVDDSSVMRKIVERSLRQAGLDLSKVSEAGNGAEALSVLADHQVDLILCDINMPVMDGLEFIKQVRALGYKGRVLVMSGRFSASACQAYQDLEVSGFLSKPFDIGMVATMLLQAD